jgi:hypothetical protein
MVELVVMYNKHHFYNVLVYLLIFSIIALGYFDKYYMRFVLFNLFFSVITDLTWLVVEASVIYLIFRLIGHLLKLLSIQLYKLPFFASFILW